MSKELTEQEEFIRDTIDGLVAQSGYPVVGETLTRSGVADRSILRAMTRKGLLKSFRLEVEEDFGGFKQTYNVYYTERVAPTNMEDE